MFLSHQTTVTATHPFTKRHKKNQEHRLCVRVHLTVHVQNVQQHVHAGTPIAVQWTYMCVLILMTFSQVMSLASIGYITLTAPDCDRAKTCLISSLILLTQP